MRFFITTIFLYLSLLVVEPTRASIDPSVSLDEIHNDVSSDGLVTRRVIVCTSALYTRALYKLTDFKHRHALAATLIFYGWMDVCRSHQIRFSQSDVMECKQRSHPTCAAIEVTFPTGAGSAFTYIAPVPLFAK